tara:strand:+ start:14515 stop:15393 length:879 start_codon:yes stop_codon:yes gene_type:complete
MIKLNVGASPIWDKPGWHTLDHKVRDKSDTSLQGDAASIPLKNDTCSTVFTSHMFEHIPNIRLEKILLEFNRVLSKDGVLRILTPDLKKIAKAYASEDKEFFDKAKLEDENIRTDLGLGGMFMNFIVSPGQDTALYDRGLSEFIAGYAHLYSYDFEMLRILLERTGFHCVEQKDFCESEIEDYREPLHVDGMKPVWQNFNQKFYKENDLIHYYDSDKGKYVINFKVTGFDRDPLTSLIIEARKNKTINLEHYKSLNNSPLNYNKYAWSLLKDKEFSKKNEIMLKASKSVNKK